VSVMLLVVSYASAAVFVGAVVYRFIRISRMPIHLRWELYPVAHETGRAAYGGSYLEELNWWTKPRRSSLVGELKVMVPEIVLLAGVWKHNRRHWLRSFPFHFGLYLLAGVMVLLVVGGVAVAGGARVSAQAGLAGSLLFHLTGLLGFAGLGLSLLGAVALLVRRACERDYREYTKHADYFNLLFFVAVFVVALAAHAVDDPHFAALRAHVARLVTFDFSSAGAPSGSPTVLGAAEIVLVSLLLAYVPLTHMSHFFTKWFTYHAVRWNDEPNLPGGKIESEVAKVLQYPVSWSAPHIRGDGKKTWVDVASAGVEEEENEKP